jgi:hypothetical protein
MAQTAADPARTVRRPRRTYLVDRVFQLKYTLLLMGVGLVVALIFGLWIYQAHRQSIALLATDPMLWPEIRRVDRQLLIMFAGIAVLMSATLGLVGVLITHRVAGPVFVMGYYMSVLAEGRYPRMRTLRKSDELRSFFEVFLHAVAKLKERESIHAAMLEDAVAQLRAAHAPGTEAAIEALEAAALERRNALSVDDPDVTPQYVPAPRGPGFAGGS